MDNDVNKRVNERRSDSRRENDDRRMDDRRRVVNSWEDNYPAATLIKRLLAKIADYIIIGILVVNLNIIFPFNIISAFFYIFIADGLFKGSSFGKKLIGIRTVYSHSMEPISYKESIIRNLPFAFLLLLFIIPLWGWVLFFIMAPVILLFEAYMAWSDEMGRRLGDVLAGTAVVEYRDLILHGNKDENQKP